MASTTLEIVISATDRFSGTANKVIGSLNRMDTAAGRVGKGFGQLGAGIARAGLIIGTAAGTGLVGIAKHTIGWESALAGVNKTMDLTDTELQQMGASIRQLALEIPLGTTELAGLVEQAGALGIAKGDVVEFARVAATLGVTTNVAADQAATSLGILSNLLGMQGQDLERFGSALVDLGNKGESTEAQILAIAERAAGGAATIGLATDQLLGFSSAVANIGMEPEAGGSQLQTFFLTAQKHIAASGDELRIWAHTAKMSASDFARAFEKDPAAALQSFVKGLSKLDKNARINVLDDLGLDNIRMSRMLLGLAEAERRSGNLSEALNVSADAWRANTAMAEEADKRYGTVQSKLALLKNQFLEGALVIGEGFLPALGRVADKLKTILGDEKTRGRLTQFGKDIGAFLDGIDWEEAIEGGRSLVSVLSGAAAVAKTMFDIFRMLPDEIEAGVAGFLALNKLSGGLIGAGAGNIIGGLGETLARSAGSRLPGVGKLFAQPVFVTNFPPGLGMGMGGPGAAGGGLKSMLTGLLKIAIPAAVIVGLTSFVQDNLITPGLQEQAGGNITGTEALIARGDATELTNAINGLKEMPDKLDPLQRVLYDLNANGVKTHTESLIAALEAALAAGKPSGEVLGPPAPGGANAFNVGNRAQSDAARDEHGGYRAGVRGGGQDAVDIAEHIVRRFGNQDNPKIDSMVSFLAAIRTGQGTSDGIISERLDTLGDKLELVIAEEKAEIERLTSAADRTKDDAVLGFNQVTSGIANMASASKDDAAVVAGKIDAVQSEAALARGQAVIAEITRSIQAVQAISQQMRTADGVIQTKNAVNNARSGIISAIRANRPIVNVDVSATTVVRTSVVQERAGRQSGSRGQGRTAS